MNSTKKAEFIEMNNTQLLQQEESLNTTDSKESSSKIKSEEFEVIEKQGNPMVIIRQNKNYFVGLGNQRLSVIFDTLEEAEKDLNRTDWERMLQVMHVAIKSEKEAEKINNLKIV